MAKQQNSRVLNEVIQRVETLKRDHNLKTVDHAMLFALLESLGLTIQGDELNFKLEHLLQRLRRRELIEPTNWLTTRQAYNQYGQEMPYHTFRKLAPDQLRSRFGLEADSTQKIRGRTTARWLRKACQEEIHPKLIAYPNQNTPSFYVDACIDCGSPNLALWGFNKPKTKQRYKCKHCGKIFIDPRKL